MKTLLLTHYLSNYAEVGLITDKAREDYCANWRALGRDYTHRAVVGDYCALPFGFQRMKLIRDILDEPNAPDLVFWQGCDTIITNPNVAVEDITEGRHTRDYHFYVTYDVHGINADSFLIRNTPWARQWLDFILSKEPEYRNDCWSEQRVIQHHWQDERWLYRILTLPQSVANSYLYVPLYQPWPQDTPGQFKRGDYLLHLPGCDKTKRLDIFRSDWLRDNTVSWSPR